MRLIALTGFALAGVLSTFPGCFQGSADLYPVRGIVRFPDGKILRDGSVEFELTQRDPPITSTGTIGPDGSFMLGTFAADDGAPAGKHRVVVIADYEIGNGAERPGLIPEPQLNARYRDFSTSGLEFEVKPQVNNFVIQVEYATPAENEKAEQNEADR